MHAPNIRAGDTDDQIVKSTGIKIAHGQLFSKKVSFVSAVYDLIPKEANSPGTISRHWQQ